MNKLVTIIFLFGLISPGLSQNLIKDYKSAADKSVSKYFDSAVASKVKCDRFMLSDANGSSRFLYNENKNKRMAFQTITFNYLLFDKGLNENIYFYISVNKSHLDANDSSLIKRVPICIRRLGACNFISSDSAKKISIIDSIEYRNDLSCELERNKIDKEFYWVVTGHRPSVIPNISRRNSNLYAEGVSLSQRRIINAMTGKILSYQKFEYDW